MARVPAGGQLPLVVGLRPGHVRGEQADRQDRAAVPGEIHTASDRRQVTLDHL